MSQQPTDKDILVIGAGIIGLTTALRLASLGREVTLLDPAAPASGASYGNAGTIADYAVMPVGSPQVLRNLPALLLDRNSPLAIRRAAILTLAPWLARFFVQSLPANTLANIKALVPLVSDAAPRWQALANETKASPVLQAGGCLYLYTNKQQYAAGQRDIKYRKTLGINGHLLSPEALAHLEPNLPMLDGGAAFFPDAVFLRDPSEACELIFSAAQAQGVEYLAHQATEIRQHKQGVRVTLDNGRQLQASQVVIAAGAHSKNLARQAGDKIPLETERGYHLEYDCPQPLLQRPACASAGGFYMTPMSGRLRVAGTVELGGLSPAPSQHRLDCLQRGTAEFFPALAQPQRTWLGFRPSLPDSRPVISASRYGNKVVYAFGHGHIGLTLAPITADAVAALIMDTTPPLDLAPYSAQRF
jgi:glycine/D-amino acid oxidase-like deaminating enzyme